MSITAQHMPTRTLLLPGVPAKTLEALREIAEGRSPRLTRNNFILWLLEEAAAGRVVHVDETGEATPVPRKEVA